MRAIVLLLVLSLAVLAGCVETTSPVDVTPYYVINDAQPGRGTEFAFHVRSTSPFKQDLPLRAEGPAGWRFEFENDTIELRGKDTSSLIVRVTPDENATYAPHDVHVYVGDTFAKVTVNVHDLGREPLRAGIGAQLYYVLWWDNGTLASTNDPALRGRSLLGDAVLDDVANGTEDVPLRAYVGGKRGEDPPEPYNGTGYRSLIDGFDARLRDAGNGQGMVAGETLAVRIPKEKAYTQAGNEGHPLYGDDLNFLIRIVTVDVLTARSCVGGLPVCPLE